MFRVEERRASDLHSRLRQASEDVHAGLASAAASCGGTRSGIQPPDSAARRRPRRRRRLVVVAPVWRGYQICAPCSRSSRSHGSRKPGADCWRRAHGTGASATGTCASKRPRLQWPCLSGAPLHTSALTRARACATTSRCHCAGWRWAGRLYTMDVRHPLMVVGTADRNILVYNLANPQATSSPPPPPPHTHNNNTHTRARAFLMPH